MPRDGSDRGGTELYFLSAQTFDGISGSAVLKVDTPLQDSAEVSEPQGGHFAFSEARIWAKEKRTLATPLVLELKFATPRFDCPR